MAANDTAVSVAVDCHSSHNNVVITKTVLVQPSTDEAQHLRVGSGGLLKDDGAGGLPFNIQRPGHSTKGAEVGTPLVETSNDADVVAAGRLRYAAGPASQFLMTAFCSFPTYSALPSHTRIVIVAGDTNTCVEVTSYM